MRILNGMVARRGVLLASAACLVLASSGCSFFESMPARHQLSENADGPSFTVEYHPHRGKGWQKKYPMSGPTYVSTALEQANATKKLGDMNISVYRNVKDTNRNVAMAVQKQGKRVSPNTDYTLHDGDRVVIKEDISGPIDHLMGLMPSAY
jgi:hypothetical protein